MTTLFGPSVSEAKNGIGPLVRSLRAAAVAEDRVRLPFIGGDDERLWDYPPFIERMKDRGHIEQRIIDMVTNLAEDKRRLLGANSRLVHHLGRLASEGAAVSVDKMARTLTLTMTVDGDSLVEAGIDVVDAALMKMRHDILAKLEELTPERPKKP